MNEYVPFNKSQNNKPINHLKCLFKLFKPHMKVSMSWLAKSLAFEMPQDASNIFCLTKRAI